MVNLNTLLNWSTVLLCLLLSACINTKQDLASEQILLKKQLDAHIQEWAEIKPTIERLSQSEQDLNFLIAELEKQSTLAATPSNTQLNDNANFTPPPPPVTEIRVENPVTNIEFGIHLASYQQQKNLVEGWHLYQNKYHLLLKDKKAMMQIIALSGKQYRRLIAAPYKSVKQAQIACQKINQGDGFCNVISYPH